MATPLGPAHDEYWGYGFAVQCTAEQTAA